MPASHRNDWSRTKAEGRTHNIQPISQADLQRLLDLDNAARGREKLRNEVIERLQSGADVEAGELSASLELRTIDRPTWESLTPWLAPRTLAKIRETYDRPTIRCLHIYDRNGNVLR